MKLGSVLAALVPLFFFTVGWAETAVDLSASRRVLDNGLEVIARSDRRAPVAALQLWVRAGSVHEREGMGAGISHFVEHLAFRDRPGEEEGVTGRIQRLGGEVNAYTSVDHTVYHLKLPSRHWEEGLRCLRRLVMEVEFTGEDVELEREVILREINMDRDDPGRRLSRLLWSTAFPGHPYRHPVLGHRELVSALTLDELEDYYRRRYVPNNIFLVAAGDFDPEEFFAAAAGIFTEPRGSYPDPFVPTAEFPAAPRKASDRMDVSLARTALAFHAPGFGHPDAFALDLLAILAGGGRSSRLRRRVQEEKELVYSIGAHSTALAAGGLFQVWATAEPENLVSARTAILEVLEGFEAGVAEEELAKARRQASAAHIRSLATVEGQARRLGYGYLLAGTTDYASRYLEEIAAVDGEDIGRVARKYLRPDRMVEAVLKPRPEASPAADPAPEEPREFKRILDNGLTVIVRPDSTLPMAWIRLVFRGGVLAGEDPGSFELLSQLLLKGSGRRSAEQIAVEIEEDGGSLSAFSGRNSFGLSLDVLSGRLPSSLDVLGDIVTAPLFPADELERERSNLLARIRAEKEEPRGLASRLLLETFFEDHPYRDSPLGDQTSVAGIDRDALVELHREYCVAGNAVLAVFGDVDPDGILSLLEQKLGGLPEGERRRPEGRHAPPVPAVRRRVETLPGIEQAVVYFGFPGADVFGPERFALEILTSHFSGLASPLFHRVRDRLGLAYFVGAYQILGLDPGVCVFYAGTVPGRTDDLLEAFWEEIGRVRDDGLSEEEIRSNVARLLSRHRFAAQDYGRLALLSALDELYGLGYDSWREYESNLLRVDNRKLKETARTLFDPEIFALVIVQPQTGLSPDDPGATGKEEE